eukprot:gene41435-51205_t
MYFVLYKPRRPDRSSHSSLPHRYSGGRMKLAVIGGGAAGALAAVHLARTRGAPHEIVIVDPDADVGRGRAYSTRDHGHLLNVRTANMS